MKMELKIKSKAFGETFTFEKDSSSSYVFLWRGSDEDSERVQICEGGGFWDGPTVMSSGDDQKQFEKTCRSWYRAHLKKWPRE